MLAKDSKAEKVVEDLYNNVKTKTDVRISYRGILSKTLNETELLKAIRLIIKHPSRNSFEVIYNGDAGFIDQQGNIIGINYPFRERVRAEEILESFIETY